MSVNIEQVRDNLSDEILAQIFYETYNRHKNSVGSVDAGAMIVARREIYDAITKDYKAEIEALRAERGELVDAMKDIALEKLPYYQHQIVAHRILSKIKMREMMGGKQ